MQSVAYQNNCNQTSLDKEWHQSVCRDYLHPQIKVGQLSVTDERMNAKVSVNYVREDCPKCNN